MFLCRILFTCAVAVLCLAGNLLGCATVHKVYPLDHAGDTEGIHYALPETVVRVTVPVTRVDAIPSTVKSGWASLMERDERIENYERLGRIRHIASSSTLYELDASKITVEERQRPGEWFRVAIDRSTFLQNQALLVELDRAGLVTQAKSEVEDLSLDYGLKVIEFAASFATAGIVGRTEPPLMALAVDTVAVENEEAVRLGAERLDQLFTAKEALDKKMSAYEGPMNEFLFSQWRDRMTAIDKQIFEVLLIFAGAVRRQEDVFVFDVTYHEVPEDPLDLLIFHRQHGFRLPWKQVDAGHSAEKRPVSVEMVRGPENWLNHTQKEGDTFKMSVAAYPEHGVQLAGHLRLDERSTHPDDTGKEPKESGPIQARGFYYRVPVSVNFKLTHHPGNHSMPRPTSGLGQHRPVFELADAKDIDNRQMYLPQLGVVQSLPSRLSHAKSVLVDLKFDETTGGLRSIGIDRSAPDPDMFDAAHGRLLSHYEARQPAAVLARAKTQSEARAALQAERQAQYEEVIELLSKFSGGTDSTSGDAPSN